MVMSNSTSRAATGDHGFVSDVGNFHPDADVASRSAPATNLTYGSHGGVAVVHVNHAPYTRRRDAPSKQSVSSHTSTVNTYVDTVTGAIIADRMPKLYECTSETSESCNTETPPATRQSWDMSSARPSECMVNPRPACRQSWDMSSARPSECMMNLQHAERQSWVMSSARPSEFMMSLLPIAERESSWAMSSARPSEFMMSLQPIAERQPSWDMSSARPSGIGIISSPLAAYTTVSIAATALRSPHTFTVSL